MNNEIKNEIENEIKKEKQKAITPVKFTIEENNILKKNAKLLGTTKQLLIYKAVKKAGFLD